jgi:hypothetical protein
VVSVHLSFGFARHIGQRTDNMCRNVSFSGFTFTIIQCRPFEKMVNYALCDLFICRGD